MKKKLKPITIVTMNCKSNKNKVGGIIAPPIVKKEYIFAKAVLAPNDAAWCDMLAGNDKKAYRYSAGIRTALAATRAIYATSLMELRGFFSIGEWQFLAQMLKNRDIDFSEIVNKSILCSYIIDPCYDTLGDYYGVDRHDLVIRINDVLTASHVFTIWMRVHEYWSNTQQIEFNDWANL